MNAPRAFAILCVKGKAPHGFAPRTALRAADGRTDKQISGRGGSEKEPPLPRFLPCLPFLRAHQALCRPFAAHDLDDLRQR